MLKFPGHTEKYMRVVYTWQPWTFREIQKNKWAIRTNNLLNYLKMWLTMLSSNLLHFCLYLLMQHLLHLKFYSGYEKKVSFHLISKSPFQWGNPKVIRTHLL